MEADWIETDAFVALEPCPAGASLVRLSGPKGPELGDQVGLNTQENESPGPMAAESRSTPMGATVVPFSRELVRTAGEI
jgi:hypothetical protein